MKQLVNRLLITTLSLGMAVGLECLRRTNIRHRLSSRCTAKNFQMENGHQLAKKLPRAGHRT